MTGRTLTLSALVALTQAKAIVTNHCPHEVYIWSIPQVGSSHTDNVPIKPGGRYEEPWRHGSTANPGIALKISPQANGINQGKDEIDFAYSIDKSYKTKVWVDLSPIHGKAFDNNLSFHTCHGPYHTPDVQTQQCDAADDIELVLCDTARTTPAKDTTPFDQIQECYDYHHVYHESEHEYPECTPDCDEETDEDQPQCTPGHYMQPEHDRPKPSASSINQPSHSESSQGPGLHTSAQPYQPAPRPTTNKPPHGPSPQPSTGRPYSPAPPKHSSEEHYTPLAHTSEHHYSPPTATTDEPHYPLPEHTDAHYPPPNHTDGHGPTPQHSSEEQHQPPTHTSDEHHSGPPSRPTQGGGPPPRPSSEASYPAPRPATNPYHPPPKHTSDEHHSGPPPRPTSGGSPPPRLTSEDNYPVPRPTTNVYYPPPKHTLEEPHYPPSQPTEDRPSILPHPIQPTDDSQYSPPRPTDDDVDHPHHPPHQPNTDKPYYPPPKPTKGGPPQPHHPPPASTVGTTYSPPSEGPPVGPTSTSVPKFRPTRTPYPSPHKPVDEAPYSPPSKPSYRPRTIHSELPCQKPRFNKASGPDHCLARIVYPWRRTALLRDRNNTSVQAKPRSTIPLSAVLQHEAAKRGNATQSVKKAAVPTPLCDILRKYYPGISDCDEEAMKLYANEIHPYLCEPDYKELLHGVDCRKVKEELKKAFPGVDKPVGSKLRDPLKRCILPWCEPAQPGINCEEIEKTFDDRDKHLNIDWTSDDEACTKFLAATNTTRHASTQKLAKDKYCIAQLCFENNLSDKACEEAEDFFEQVAKDNGEDIDYTTDDDACGKSLAARNTTLPVVAKLILSRTPATLTTREEEEICVLPYCNGLTESACDKAEDLLEQLARDDGKDIDYTTDDDVCGTRMVVGAANFTSVLERNDREV
ncbi:Nn.00g046750.m01.CDS01 [Neocucurbitaria sp. VM-36]